jgi:hypothetical protein
VKEVVPEVVPEVVSEVVSEIVPQIVAEPLARHRPDLPTFANAVRAHALDRAMGWAGNRKAFISHIWSTVAEKRRDWGLTEIEFKCMLAEAHRAGHIVLANADLKDAATIKDVQASAVSFKNAVFHFVRVDD